MKVSVKLKSFFNSEAFYLYSIKYCLYIQIRDQVLAIICMSRDPAVLIARRKILGCQIKSMNVA